MSEYRLATATEEHLKDVISWFHNQEQLTQWGGPGLEFGVSVEEFAQQIKFLEMPSYCLMSGDKICGFGQFYTRLGRHHLGRLAISPEYRGKRLARVLLTQLMKEAPKLQAAKGFSLFVLEHNIPAIRTYQGLGFEFSEYPGSIPGGLENCRYMILDNYSAGSSER